MEESQNTPQPSPAPMPKNNWFKFFLLGFFIIILSSGLVLGGYYFGQQKSPQTPTPTLPSSATTSTPEITPLITKVNPQDSGIPIKANTVSFARVSDNTYLRYKGKIYDVDDPQQLSPKEVNLPISSQQNWHGLVDAPENTNGFDEIFSFKTVPNSSNFLFVMRWNLPVGNDRFKQEIKTYYYNALIPSDKVTNLFSFTIPPDQNYNFPKIDQISPDGKYVSFNMFACWNCGGHKPETSLLNLNNNQTKRIGKVSYFNWTNNGAYEYKDYIVITCPTPTPGGTSEFYQGECFEEPKNLPLKSGQL